jgi:hypothetical protein
LASTTEYLYIQLSLLSDSRFPDTYKITIAAWEKFITRQRRVAVEEKGKKVGKIYFNFIQKVVFASTPCLISGKQWQKNLEFIPHPW